MIPDDSVNVLGVNVITILMYSFIEEVNYAFSFTIILADKIKIDTNLGLFLHSQIHPILTAVIHIGTLKILMGD